MAELAHLASLSRASWLVGQYPSLTHPSMTLRAPEVLCHHVAEGARLVSLFHASVSWLPASFSALVCKVTMLLTAKAPGLALHRTPVLPSMSPLTALSPPRGRAALPSSPSCFLVPPAFQMKALAGCCPACPLAALRMHRTAWLVLQRYEWTGELAHTGAPPAQAVTMVLPGRAMDLDPR